VVLALIFYVLLKPDGRQSKRPVDDSQNSP